MYWLLSYDYVDDYLERRQAFREEHLARIRAAHARGELLLAGALEPPPQGALLVFRTEDATLAEEFARGDPYVREGIVTGWRVREWTVVVGGQPLD